MKHAIVIFLTIVISGCMTISDRIFHQKLPKFKNEVNERSSIIRFSNEKKYESEDGVPLKGEPVICRNGQAYTALNDNGDWYSLSMIPDEEIAVTIVITWNNSGWTKTCWPFVAFVPEKNTTYTVVNERIGGKGWSALWTGVALQSCEVSIYKENDNAFEKVPTYKPPVGICGILEKQ